MNSSTEIRVPRETVNDDLVTIAAWHRAHGERVREKDVVVSIETSKAVLEVEAERDGFLVILHAQGAEVPVGELIGHVQDAQPTNNAPKSTPSAAHGATSATGGGAAPAGTASTPGGGYTISKKAQRLLDEYKIDPAVFEGQGLVREADVIRHLEQRQKEAHAAPTPQPAAAPSAAARPGATKSRGGLFGDARTSAGERGKGLAWLVWNYFWRNWLLGNLVKVAPRGVNLTLHKWRGVKMGRDCFIDPTAIVETAYPENITLGDDVRITAGCVIMTHIKAPHYLRDTGIMPAVLKPVVLEDHCFIGVNSVVMPGVTVGKASVVASGSVVVSSVPPYTMVAGNPAKVIKRFPNPDAGS